MAVLASHLAGYLFWRALRGGTARGAAWVVRASVSCAVAGAWRVAGYYVAEAFVLGLGPRAAAAEIPGNVFQMISGMVVGLQDSWVLRGVGAVR